MVGFFLIKEILVWVAVKRDLWEALDCGLKDEIGFSTKEKRNEEKTLWWGIAESKGTEVGTC